MQAVLRNLALVVDELLNLSHVLQGDAIQTGDMLVVVDVEGIFRFKETRLKPWQTLREHLDYLQKSLAWIGNRISAPRDGRICVILCKYVIG